jgi:hypothetical protein
VHTTLQIAMYSKHLCLKIQHISPPYASVGPRHLLAYPFVSEFVPRVSYVSLWIASLLASCKLRVRISKTCPLVPGSCNFHRPDLFLPGTNSIPSCCREHNAHTLLPVRSDSDHSFDRSIVPTVCPFEPSARAVRLKG